MKQQDEVAKLESHFGDLALKYQQQGLKDIDLTEQLEKGKAEIRRKYRKMETDEQKQKNQEMADLEETFFQLSIQNMEEGEEKRVLLLEEAEEKEKEAYERKKEELRNRLEEKEITEEEYRRRAELLEGIHQENMGRITKVAAEDAKKIEQNKYDQISQLLGSYSSLYREIAQAGIETNKKAFFAYKAFAIAEGMISAASAYLKALDQKPPNPVLAALTFGLGMAKVGMIAAQQPPSFDQGGISTRPGVYYSGVPEAHIPLRGGKVPVAMNTPVGSASRINVRSNPVFVQSRGDNRKIVNIYLTNPTFQDLNQQYQVMETIAKTVTRQFAPSAVIENYQNDGAIRKIVRSGR